MENNTFKPSGTGLSAPQSNRAKRLGLTLSVILLPLLLANCVTTRETATSVKALCAAWRAISYSAKGDTQMTVTQIRKHNAVGKRLRCWK